MRIHVLCNEIHCKHYTFIYMNQSTECADLSLLYMRLAIQHFQQAVYRSPLARSLRSTCPCADSESFGSVLTSIDAYCKHSHLQIQELPVVVLPFRC